MAKLIGDELLEFVRENAGADRDVVIEGAGYISNRGGRPSLQRTEFFQALSAAQGVTIGRTVPRSNKGKEPAFRLKVGATGTVPLGSAYTSKINVSPGEYVAIELDGDCLVISPAT